MENENLKPIEKLTPFTKMIMTIGTLPSSFYSSMSYYESMVWLYEYLKNQVIPAVNNNAEAVQELQNAYLELKDWIENYFENLDVQEEINNKLDEMATDGTLTNLIKNYVDPIYEAYETEINGRIDDQDTLIDNRLDSQDDKLAEQDDEIDSFKNSINLQVQTINDKVSNITSGSPKGVYATVSDLQTADPDHDYVYVVSADGKWYYYNTSLTSWVAGGDYQSTGIGYEEIKESNIDNQAVTSYKILDGVISANVYNKASDIDNTYIGVDGNLVSASNNLTSDFIYTNDASNIYINIVRYLTLNEAFIVGEYDENKNFIKRTSLTLTNDMTYDSDHDIYYYNLNLASGTKYVRYSCYYADNRKYQNKVMINLTNRTTTYTDYYWYINNQTHARVINLENTIQNLHTFDNSIYELPYITNKKVKTNKTNVSQTANYAGVECNNTIYKLKCNYIWESGNTYSGVLALVINPNGVDRINDITDLSLHCTFRNNLFNVDVFGRRFNPAQNLYQRLISQEYSSPQSMDGETEHTIEISIAPSINTVTVIVDNVTYTATFTPDTNITRLNEVIGKYGTFEFYCDGDRDSINMPLVTYFELDDVNNRKMVIDNFKREDGQLNNAPTGQTYHLINNNAYTRS